MELLAIIGLGLALGVAGWIVGFVRAVRRQTINDRLKTYCQRQ
jgi:hypothetical protein